MIYVLLFAFLIIGSTSSKPNRRSYLAFVSLIFWLLIGFRGPSVGVDTAGYIADFNSFGQLGLANLLQAFREKSEPLYILIMWLSFQVSENYTLMLLVWALFPVLAMYASLKQNLQNSTDYCISILTLFLLGFFVFFTAGIRQTATISLVLYSYKYLKEPLENKLLKDRNTWKFLLCIGIGYLIHNSILLFLFVYPIKAILQNVRIKWWYLLFVIALFFAGSAINISQVQVVSQFLFNDRYWQYGETYESSWNASAFIMQFLLFIFCFLMRNRLAKRDNSNTLLLNLVMIGLVFQSMSGVLAEMARVSYYFSIFYLILLPKAIREISNNGKNNAVYIVFIAVSLVYLIFLTSTNLPVYKFFWD